MMKLFWLPSACTAANLAAGVISLKLTIDGEYIAAFVLVMIAAFWDVLDGLLARLLHVSSEYGKNLDSIADVISFGVAPIFLMFLNNLQDMPRMSELVIVIFPVCGALRLARFNIQPKESATKGFIGLPITAAGVILAGVSVLGAYVHTTMMIIIVCLLSCLMISRIPFPSFKK
ncbi:CDP-diacylglycerol--serine O-phosphatidyltransferase [Paenibacillus sp. IHBB 10380]|uniref:CDP-diacylglycerol--serine O-phosphatidyltransferase n=1 Tax=Paenibacillus sp. IHBB 10380 TaxID=1566358 RepID=UPI000AC5496A|nr:CDP-diacylglycerol--serine O-phosphatidyltransferase [Paenibacillus sp. IHBB 10380]